MTTSVWTPYVSAVLNGTALTGKVTKARVVSTFSDPVAKLYATVYPEPTTWTQGQSLTLALGGGQHNVLRGSGSVFEGDNLNVGPDFELVARGPLIKAQRYRNNNTSGLTLVDLTGGPATDEAITRAVLTGAGVPYVSGNIGGTGIVRGTLAPAAYTWRFGETALEYLARLSQASLGYQVIESIGGDVLRVQASSRPNTTSTVTLTEGVDIFDGGHTQKQTFGKYDAVTVTGFDYGEGAGPVEFSNPDPIPAGVDPYVYASPMIERALEADPGSGVSAEAVNAFVFAQVTVEQIRVSNISTPRDDVFGPGQTHTITSPRLGLSNALLRLIAVTCEVNSGWFTQTLEYIGGGTTTGGYTGP
jgi:hypothetical protein